jgi:hypothetical protein
MSRTVKVTLMQGVPVRAFEGCAFDSVVQEGTPGPMRREFFQMFMLLNRHSSQNKVDSQINRLTFSLSE